MQNIAFVTYQEQPELSESDALLVEPLAKQGYRVDVAAWDDPNVDWKSYHAVILRSCWNYYEKFDHFLNWLDMLEKKQILVWNPLPILRWNSNKRYVQELSNNGIPTVPTMYFEKGSHVLLT